MTVRTMRRLIDQIEMGAMPQVVVDAAERWDAAAPRHFRSSANHVFRVLHEGRARFLRLAPGSERSSAGIRAELDFVLHAARAGVLVARPLPSSRGLLVEELSDREEIYYAVLFDNLEGKEHDIDGLDRPMIRAWGRTLASLHVASETLPAQPARARWPNVLLDVLQMLPAGETAVAGALRSGLACLQTLPLGEHGLLHGDLELDNVRWDHGRPHVLDFDGAFYGPRAIDVAIALGDVLNGPVAARDERVSRFLDGYAEVRRPPAGTELLPRLARLVTAVKVADLLRAYAGLDEDGAPEWLSALRARHRRWLDTSRSQLADLP